MERRRFISTLAGGAVAISSWPLAGRGQTAASKRPVVAWLGSGTEAKVGPYIGSLRKGLEELGYVERRDFELVSRLAENHVERLPALATEVVSLGPSLIVAGAVDAAVAAKRVTPTIPIVSGALADADHLGLVASYAHPGGNVTGIAPYVAGLPAKQLEIARALVPSASRIGVLGNMYDPKAPPQREELNNAAQKLGVQIVVAELQGPDDLGRAIEMLADERVQAVIVLETTMLLSMRQEIAPLMAAKSLPALYGYKEHVEEGGLISYGVDLKWCWHRLAVYVDKILRGASPADLPVEFPTRLQMVVNLRAARELGIVVPPQFLASADELLNE